MARMKTILVAAFLLVLAACNKEQPAPLSPQKQTAQAAVADDGVQTVTIVVSDMGYAPGTVELKAGVKTRLVFDQQSKSACAGQVQIPSQGVKPTDLPFGQKTVVEFTPKEAGSFNFACGMDMMKGTILVKG